MIIEQSFYALPEFLVGAGFAAYEAEGTLVMAYAMAILQELNGRGVNNPIKEIRGEVSYPGTANRAADIHLNYDRIGVLTTELMKYGVRPDNWLEAKFFRKNSTGRPTLSELPASYSVLRDLLRLAAFVPEPNPEGSSTAGRYLLHVYQDDHEDHLTLETNTKVQGKPREKKGWLLHLHEPGTQALPVSDFTAEPGGFDTEIGVSLRTLQFDGSTTTLAVNPAGARYALYLTRLDEFKLVLCGDTIQIQGGICWESGAGVWKRVCAAVDDGLKK